MDYFKNRVFSFLDDRLQLMSLFGFIAISVISFLNYISEPNLEWKLRICIFTAGIFLTFFLGNKGTWLTWCIDAYVMFYFSHYRNCTYFALICILICFYDRLRYILLGGYIINLFTICHLHNLSIKHICYHIICCGFIYFSITEICRRVKRLTKKKLELLADEIIILDYLLQDIQQNDIPEFSSVTVSRKLRQAKIRNGISNTELLVERYKVEKKETE